MTRETFPIDLFGDTAERGSKADEDIEEPCDSAMEKINGGCTTLCARCDGTGFYEGELCFSCGGTGWRR